MAKCQARAHSLVTPATKTTIKNDFVIEIVWVDINPTQKVKLLADALTSHSDEQQYTGAGGADSAENRTLQTRFLTIFTCLRNKSWVSFYIYGHAFFHKIICS